MTSSNKNGATKEQETDQKVGLELKEISVIEQPRPTDDKDHIISNHICCYRSMYPFTFYYGIVSLVTSAVAAYMTSQVTTIEKQFGLSSSESGLLLSMNDAGFLISVLFISYFGRNTHIPRLLAVCAFLFGIFTVVCVIPHFLTLHEVSLDTVISNGTQNSSASNMAMGGLCRVESTSNQIDPKCSEKERYSSSIKPLAFGLIALGFFFQGVVKSPRVPMSQTYIDDNVPKTEAGVHMGILLGLAVFGPAIAFGLGGSISRIYVTLEDTNMSTRDPRWIGAWWLGFLIFGGLSLVLSFPLLIFPRHLDTAPVNPQLDRSTNTPDGSLKKLLVLIKGVLQAFKRLSARPVFIFLLLALGARIFAIAAVSAFTPKYLQIHYGLSVFKANIIIGFVAVGSASAAIFLSGILVRVFKLEIKGMIGLTIIFHIISSVVFVSGIFFVCPQPYIQDFDFHRIQSNSPALLSTNTSCYTGCDCAGTRFFPICGSDGVTYFSPCHAGCQTVSDKGYSDCSCLSNGTNIPEVLTSQAVPGICDGECPFYIGFVIIQFLSSFFAGLTGVPSTLSILRSVDTKEKSLSLGINAFVSSLLGWFLGPIVMGSIIDTTCVLWNTSCSEDGSCAVYDIVDLRYKLHGLEIGVSVLYITLYCTAYWCLTCGKKGQADIRNDISMEIKKGIEY